MIELGDKVRDKVTGYEGIATSKTEFLNGCTQIEVTPKIKKGTNPTPEQMIGMGIDQQQLEKVGNGVNTPTKKIESSDTGGRMRRVPRKAY